LRLVGLVGRLVYTCGCLGQHSRPAGTLAAVDAKDLRDLVRFSEDGPHRETLHESTRLWSEIVCLERAQALGPIADPDSDAILTVVAGEVAVQVDRGRKRLPQWGSVLVPAGAELTLRNASTDPAVILLVTAPPPADLPAPE